MGMLMIWAHSDYLMAISYYYHLHFINEEIRDPDYTQVAQNHRTKCDRSRFQPRDSPSTFSFLIISWDMFTEYLLWSLSKASLKVVNRF